MFPVYFWRRVIFFFLPAAGRRHRRWQGCEGTSGARPCRRCSLESARWDVCERGWGSDGVCAVCVRCVCVCVPTPRRPRCISVTRSLSSQASPNLETDRETQVAEKWSVTNEAAGRHRWVSRRSDKKTCKHEAPALEISLELSDGTPIVHKSQLLKGFGEI